MPARGGLENHIIGFEAGKLFDHRSHTPAQAGSFHPDLQGLPKGIRQEREQNMPIDTMFPTVTPLGLGIGFGLTLKTCGELAESIRAGDIVEQQVEIRRE